MLSAGTTLTTCGLSIVSVTTTSGGRRQLDVDPAFSGQLENLARRGHHLLLDQRPTHLELLGEEKGVGHAAADEKACNAPEEGLERRRLGRHLGTSDDRHKGLLRLVDDSPQRFHLALHEKAGGLAMVRVQPRNRHHRSVGPVGGAEGVVDIVAVGRRQRGCKVRIVRLFARVEAEVLEQEQRARLGPGGCCIQTIGNKGNGSSESLFEHCGHRSKGVRRIGDALGLAEVGACDHHLRPLEQPAQGWQGSDDASIVHDLAVGYRHVQVEAGQNPRTV